MTELNEQATTQIGVTTSKLEMQSTIYQKLHIVITVLAYSVIPPQVKKRFWLYIKTKRKDNTGVASLKDGENVILMQSVRLVF